MGNQLAVALTLHAFIFSHARQTEGGTDQDSSPEGKANVTRFGCSGYGVPGGMGIFAKAEAIWSHILLRTK